MTTRRGEFNNGRTRDMFEKLTGRAATGSRSPTPASAGLQAHLKAESEKWGVLIRNAGVPAE